MSEAPPLKGFRNPRANANSRAAAANPNVSMLSPAEIAPLEMVAAVNIADPASAALYCSTSAIARPLTKPKAATTPDLSCKFAISCLSAYLFQESWCFIGLMWQYSW